jgi:CheY-like chemotaxis protein
MFESPLPFGPPASILVLSSHDGLASQVVTTLRDLGFRVEHGADAAGSESWIERAAFDLWLVDATDPYLDQAAVIDKLRQSPRAVAAPCLALIDSSQSQGKPLWADGTLELPYESPALGDAVLQALWLPHVMRGKRRRGCRPDDLGASDTAQRAVDRRPLH